MADVEGPLYIVAGGPSLRDFDWSRLDGRDVLTINNAFLKVPGAKYVYFANKDWFDRFEHELRAHSGRKIQGWDGSERHRVVKPWVERYQFEGTNVGLNMTPGQLHPGGNSGYAAINLAVQLGYKRLRLLGYDMKHPGQNFHDDHLWTDHKFPQWLAKFETLVQPLKDLGVEVINLTPDSALTCFETGDFPL